MVGFNATVTLPQNLKPNWLGGWSIWLRADLGITTSTGVSAWKDVTTGLSLVQATGSAQPTYNSSDSSLNHFPSISSTSASSQNLTKASFTLAQPFTIFMVGYCPAGQNAAFCGSGSSTPYFAIGGTTVAVNAGGQRTVTVSSTTVPVVMAASVTGANGTVYGNSSTNFTGPLGVGGASFSLLEVFAITGVAYYTSTIAEIIIYPFACTQAQVSSNFSYLGMRYNQSWS